MKHFAIFLAISLFNSGNAAVDGPIVFSYDPDSYDGPHNWYRRYPDCAKGRQTPINIELASLNNGVFTSQLRMEGLDTPIQKIEVHNMALSAKIKATYAGTKPYMSGGPLVGTYALDSFHFHWGIVDDDGSEHALNSKKYPMEAHFVFYNKAYQNSSEALNHDDGFSVIGVFFDVDKNAPDFGSFDMVKNVKMEGMGVYIDNPKFTLRELMPTNFIYANYKGSFTTPPCSEIVNWIVSTKIMYMNPRQMSTLREMYYTKSRPISYNFRPLQPINGRRILKGIVSNE